jgi:hypothetical protein
MTQRILASNINILKVNAGSNDVKRFIEELSTRSIDQKNEIDINPMPVINRFCGMPGPKELDLLLGSHKKINITDEFFKKTSQDYCSELASIRSDSSLNTCETADNYLQSLRNNIGKNGSLNSWLCSGLAILNKDAKRQLVSKFVPKDDIPGFEDELDQYATRKIEELHTITLASILKLEGGTVSPLETSFEMELMELDPLGSFDLLAVHSKPEDGGDGGPIGGPIIEPIGGGSVWDAAGKVSSVISIIQFIGEMFDTREKKVEERTESEKNSKPDEKPETEPTKPPKTEPTEPPKTEPTKPPKTEPTEPPETEPTEPPKTEPTEPPKTEPTEPPETEPTLVPPEPLENPKYMDPGNLPLNVDIGVDTVSIEDIFKNTDIIRIEIMDPDRSETNIKDDKDFKKCAENLGIIYISPNLDIPLNNPGGITQDDFDRVKRSLNIRVMPYDDYIRNNPDKEEKPDDKDKKIRRWLITEDIYLFISDPSFGPVGDDPSRGKQISIDVYRGVFRQPFTELIIS